MENFEILDNGKTVIIDDVKYELKERGGCQNCDLAELEDLICSIVACKSWKHGDCFKKSENTNDVF